jgi:hypothetical protein
LAWVQSHNRLREEAMTTPAESNNPRTDAALPDDAKKWLRRVVDWGGYDGYSQDAWQLRIAVLIENLEAGIRSQIEITNTERTRKEQLERELAAARAPMDGEVAALVKFLSAFSQDAPKQYEDRLLASAAILESLSARLNAPVPEVEGQVFETYREGSSLHKVKVVPADIARDLRGRLAEATGRIARLEAKLTETSDTLDHLKGTL